MSQAFIVIVCRNNVHLTKQAIKSALAQDIPCNVVAVNNASLDNTPMYLRTQPVTVIAHKMQKSLAACWNGALKALWDIGAQEALVLNNDVEIIPQTYYCLRMLGMPFVTGVSVRDRSQLKIPRLGMEVSTRPHPDFSCFMIRRSVWDKVGPFDEEYYPAYFEDNDYHVRMHRAGITAVAADLPFYHEGSGTLKAAEASDKIAIQRGFDLNQERFRRKYGCIPGTPEYQRLFDKLPPLGQSSPTV